MSSYKTCTKNCVKRSIYTLTKNGNLKKGFDKLMKSNFKYVKNS